MKILTVDRYNCLNEELSALAQRRLLFAFSRFDSKIRTLVLNVRDLNGPKGGVDKECTLRLILDRGDDIIVSDRGAEVAACISRVADRAARTLARRIERTRDSMRRRRVTVGDP